MSRQRHTPPAPSVPAAPPGPHFGTLINWLALLMLLAGSVVWPR